jgi:histidine triad (HIT) family protein
LQQTFTSLSTCPFCQIVNGKVPASFVFEDEQTLTFLDYRPVFPGHCLLIPRDHIETLVEVQPTLLTAISANARLLAISLEKALGAQGAFVAINNRVSQSVPHLHVHIVPRTKGDGLRGFFWPRQKYRDSEHREEVRQAIASALKAAISRKQ